MNIFINPNVAKQTFPISANIYESTFKNFGHKQQMVAWKDFLNSDPEDFPMNDNWMNIFIVWYIYSWNREGIERPAIEYMADNFSTLSEIEKTFIGSCISNIYSFYKVESVEPGRHIEVSDFFSKDKHLVFETKASKKLKPGEIIFSRVASVQNLNFLVGTGMIALSQECIPAIQRLAKDRKWKKDELSRIALYFNLAAEILIAEQAVE